MILCICYLENLIIEMKCIFIIQMHGNAKYDNMHLDSI